MIRGAGVGEGVGDATGDGDGVGVWAIAGSGSFAATKPAAPTAGNSLTKVRRPTDVSSRLLLAFLWCLPCVVISFLFISVLVVQFETSITARVDYLFSGTIGPVPTP